MIPVCERVQRRPISRACTTRTNGQNSQADVLGDETLSIDEVLALAEFHDLARRESKNGADDGAKGDLVEPGGGSRQSGVAQVTANFSAPGDVEPLSDCVFVARVQDEVEREVCTAQAVSWRNPNATTTPPTEKGERRSIVAARLGREQMPDMRWNMLVCKLSSDDCLCQDLQVRKRLSGHADLPVRPRYPQDRSA